LTPQQAAARKLLGGYATNTLTRSELEILMGAALEDEWIFEELVEEEDCRAALADDPFRRRLIRRLRQSRADIRPSWSLQFARLFRLRWLTAACAAAGLIVIALIRQGVIPESSPLARIALGPGTLPALHMAGLLEETQAPERELESKSRTDPAPGAHRASLEFDRAGNDIEYRVGDRQRIGFSVPSSANVLLIEERPDGSAVRLFPNPFQSSPGVKAKETVLVPPAGQGDLEVEGPPGPRTLRLLIFPESFDPLAPDADWERVKGQAQETSRHYKVR